MFLCQCKIPSFSCPHINPSRSVCSPSLSLHLSFLVRPPSTLSVITFMSLHPSHPRRLGAPVSGISLSPSDQRSSSKPPLGSSAMTSRILLRQQLMREQLQEQERREQQRQQAAQYPQTTAAQTPAINVSAPAGLPPAAQVPMEVLKVSGRCCGAEEGERRRQEVG